jgi:hypothetical protein
MRDLCQSPEAAIAKFGKATALALFGRIADIRAADATSDLIGLIASLGDSEQEIVVPLGPQSAGRIVLKVNHPACPRDGGGEVDWAKVTRLQAVRIEADK